MNRRLQNSRTARRPIADSAGTTGSVGGGGLQPGDILLERRNWYVSNAFLPGYWPHAALYVGTTDDLKRLGLDRDPRVQAFWEAYSATDPDGHQHVIIEALSEGVVFGSLEHSIGGADSAAVLRPNLSPEEIKEAIARAFSHAAKPYDFEFDFTSRDKLVCTEVVFRAYQPAEKWMSDQQYRRQKRRSRARGLSTQKVMVPQPETAKCFRTPKQ